MMLVTPTLPHYTSRLLPFGVVMTRPRSSLVSTTDTRWYHCMSRCVRRAFLCGFDPSSGRNFDHRCRWVTNRLQELSSLFAIDVAAYAVMSNHYHLVVHLAPERAVGWSDDEVLLRWTRLFAGPPLVRRYLDQRDAPLDTGELKQLRELTAIFRKRLQDLSWYIRLLNESISRSANAEDNCSGRFWEGRFKSQALLDAPAVLSAMIYVDLNPIRAGAAPTLETSMHTSIQARLQMMNGHAPASLLMPFDATARTPWAIPFGLEDYIHLAEWTGRHQRADKRGAISGELPPVLQRLGLDADTFRAMSGQLLKTFGSAIGSPATIAEHCARRELKYLRGTSCLRQARAAVSADD